MAQPLNYYLFSISESVYSQLNTQLFQVLAVFSELDDGIVVGFSCVKVRPTSRLRHNSVFVKFKISGGDECTSPVHHQGFQFSGLVLISEAVAGRRCRFFSASA